MANAQIFKLNEYRALNLVEDGKHHISVGDLDNAIETFEESLEVCPTADAYTYLGWVLSLKGQLDEAITLCRKAIRLDPDFGNPLNDMGSYLIQKGYLDDAIPWLQKAKTASRFETKHFPYVNLGRIYSTQGKIDQAISEFREALQFSPGHEDIENVLVQLENIKKTQINA